MPKGVIVNAGSPAEYTRMEIKDGEKERVTLQRVQGFSQGKDSLGFKICKFRFGGASSLIDEDLPLSNNPREPGESKAVKEMRKTLEGNPNYFHLYNNGMTIIANSATYSQEDQSVVLEFDSSKQGICNGGHTYFAIKRAISDNSLSGEFLVNAEVLILPKGADPASKEKLTIRIAQARNFSNPIKQESLADAAGFFQGIRNALGENGHFLTYHENDSEAIEDAVQAKHFLRTLASVSPFHFKHDILYPTGPSHKGAVISDQSKVWKPWLKENEDGKVVQLAALYPLCNDILKLRDHFAHIVHTESSGTGGYKSTNLWSNWMKDKGTRRPLFTTGEFGEIVHNLPVTMEPLLIGLLRNQIYVGFDKKKKPTLIGWHRDPFAWSSMKLVPSLNSMAGDMSNIDSVAFKKLGSPYDKMMGHWDKDAGQVPSKHPAIVYDIATNIRYELKEDASQSTHRILSGKMTDSHSNSEPFNYKVA